MGIDEIQNELNECREDERNAQNQIVQVLATAGTILGVIYTAGFLNKTTDANTSNEHLLFWISCCVFIVAFTYIVVLGLMNTLRFHYMRDLEDRLALASGKPVEHVSWMNLSVSLVTKNIHHLTTAYSKLCFVIYGMVIGGASFFASMIVLAQYRRIQEPQFGDRLIGGILIIIIILTIFIYVWVGSNANEMYQILFNTAVQRKKTRINLLSKQKSTQNNRNSVTGSKVNRGKEMFSTILYFLYPKRKDVQKSFLIVIGFIIGKCIKGDFLTLFTYDDLKNLLITIIVIDVLVYQSRYQWNDIRGISEDKQMKVKRRLPVVFLGMKRACMVSLFIMFVKMGIAVVLAVKFKALHIPLMTCMITIIIITIFYEIARTKEWDRVTFFLVGLGYPIRIISGMWIAYPMVWASGKYEIILLLTAYLFYGIYSSLLAWAHETLLCAKLNMLSKKGNIKSYYFTLFACLKERYKKNGKGRYPVTLKENGKITDPWLQAFMISVLILSAIIIKDNFSTEVLLMEAVTILCFYIFCMSKFLKIYIFCVISILCTVFKIFWAVNAGVFSVISLVAIAHQIGFLLTYGFLRCLFSLEFEWKQLLENIFFLLIGPRTMEEIKKGN